MAELKYELIDLGDQHRWYTHIKVSLAYHKDGLRGGKRGYYLSCSPVRRESYDSYSCERTRGGDGVWVFIAETTRNTKKQAEKVMLECELSKLEDKESWFYKVVDYILHKHHLHITECALKEGEILHG